MLTITADNAANNNTFLKELETECSVENINFHHKKNHVRCLAHIMNLTCQEILRNIKAGEAQDENDIFNKGNFQKKCNLYPNINSPNLLLDIKTRWNSTYLMLERALMLQEPLDDITGLDRDLNAFAILKKEWSTIKELCHVLKKFYSATLYMSKSQFVTLSSSIPIYNSLLNHFELLLNKEN
ncbi:unnamed protein product [Rhizophagus irregularis]|nr:unnamed protein product [Rhizophagus irregularis]